MRFSSKLLLLSSIASLAVAGCADGRANTNDSGTRDAGRTPDIDAFEPYDTGVVSPDAGTIVQPDAGRDAPMPILIDAATVCGNGTIEGTEECEGTNLAGEDCVSPD